VSDAYDAVVYDLDGTLVRLAVDWDRAARDVVGVYEAAGVDAGDGDVWRLLAEAPEHGIGDEAEAALAEHELDGARESRRLALADEVPGRSGPVAVCSLNCEAAVREALDHHDLADHVDAVVGRDTVDGMKPDPASLLAAVERAGADPESTVFVGDSDSDETVAERAGVDFQWARDRAERGR